MKENYNILNLPQDLVEDLTTVKRININSQGWFDLASIREIQFGSIQIGPFKTKENGQYYTNSVGLIKNSESYDESHELLVWLPRLQHYGTWDSSHDELNIFPDQAWTSMKSDLVPFIEAQWGTYEGANKIKHLTIKGISKYADTFDFIPYHLNETVEKLSDDQLIDFLDQYENIILRHPNVSTLDEAYFALAKVYFRLGQKDSNQKNVWKEKCLQILNYYPQGRFHREKDAAEICVWASAEFGLKVFKNLLEKNKRQPEYAGGASLVSAFLIHFPDQWKSILEISKVKTNTIGTLHSIETAKTWALNVTNNPLAAKLKQNQKTMNLISKLLTQIEEFILSAPLGEFSEQEIHEIRHKKIVDRLTQGWEYLKKKEYSKVEELLNSIFAAYEKDGEALFLDARLFWLKSGSAEEGMKRTEKNLLLASNGDRLGRGRLHNLISCALD